MVGISSAFHIFRQLRGFKNRIMTWLYSFFNARKYLSPESDKYPDDPRLR
jgi:short-subunit dehydrogenase